MPTDRRLFDSTSMTPPPAPEIDAMTCNVETPESKLLDAFPYEVPSVPLMEPSFRLMTLQQYRLR